MLLPSLFVPLPGRTLLFQAALAAPGGALEVGAFRLEWFGLALLIGGALGVGISSRLTQSSALRPAAGGDVLFVFLLAALVGARVFYLAASPAPLTVAAALGRASGLSGFGALAGGTLGVLFFLRSRREAPLPWLDVGTPGVLVAAAITRLGCHFGGCPGPVLREAFGALVLALVCLFVRRAQRRHGAVFAVGIGGYALLRVLL